MWSPVAGYCTCRPWRTPSPTLLQAVSRPCRRYVPKLAARQCLADPARCPLPHPGHTVVLVTTRCTGGVLNATAQSRSRPSRTQLRHSEDMTSLLAITGIATTGSRHTTALNTCRRDSWVQCALLFSMMTVVTDRKAVKAGMRNRREQSAGAPPNSSQIASQRTVPPTSKTLVLAQHSRWRK